MSEFDKIKIGFAIGLLAAAFAITPLIQNTELGFTLLSVNLKIIYVFWGFIILLGLSVYFFAISLIGNNSFLTFSKKAANLAYTLSLISLPFYLSLYLIKLLTDLIELVSKNQAIGNIFQTLLSIIVGYFANVLATRILKSFKKKDIKAQVDELSKDEEKTSKRIDELFSLKQYDLVVVQVWKSIEMLLTKTLLNLDYSIKDKSILKLISTSFEQKIISKELFLQFKELVKIRNSAVHTETSISEIDAKYAIDTLNHLNQHLAKVTEQCYFCNKTFSITELKSDNVTGAFVCKDCDKSKPNWRDVLMAMGQDP